MVGRDYIPSTTRAARRWRQLFSLSCYPRDWHLDACFNRLKNTGDALCLAATKWWLLFRFFDNWIWKKEKRGWRIPADHGIVILCNVHVYRDFGGSRFENVTNNMDQVLAWEMVCLKNVLVNSLVIPMINNAWPVTAFSCGDIEANQISFQTWEFDPGSGRTLAAGLTHASRTPSSEGVADGWVTRGNLPSSMEQHREICANTVYALRGKDLSLLDGPAFD